MDRIFSDIFKETAGIAQIARLDGIKLKRVVFSSVLRSRRNRVRLHQQQGASSVKNNVTSSGKRITHLPKKRLIPLVCWCRRYGCTRGFIKVSDSGFWIYYTEGIRIISQAFIRKMHSDSQQFTHIGNTGWLWQRRRGWQREQRQKARPGRDIFIRRLIVCRT